MEILYNSYRKLKLKDKPYIRDRGYIDILISVLCSMFTYKCEDKNFNKILNRRLEYLLRTYGMVGFFKDKDNIVKFGYAHYSTDPNWHGTSDKVIITLPNGVVVEKTVDVDCVLIRNNVLAHSEINLQRFVEQLSEVDRSQVDILLNARCHPVVVANNEQTAKRIEHSIKDMKDGQPITVHSDIELTGGVMGIHDDNVKVINLTDPQTAELFQHYSHYHEWLTSRFFTLYGLSTFNTGKMAQTNNLEVSGSLASSLAIPIHNYNFRVEGIEDINNMFGLGITLDWGDVWKNQIALLNSVDSIQNMDSDIDVQVYENEGV